MFTTSIIFILFIILFLLVPSLAFSLLSGTFKEEGNNLINIGMLLIYGLVQLVLVALVLGILNVNFNWLWVLPVSSVFYLIFSLKTKNITFLSRKRRLSFYGAITILTVFLGVVTQNTVMYKASISYQSGMTVPSLHDTMWNLALTEELSHHFPPQHPGFSGKPLKNNHYFYPFFLSLINRLMGIDNFNLYYHMGPWFVSLVFGLGIYSVASIFIHDNIFRPLTVLLGYFSGSFAYFLPLFYGSQFNWQGNSFYSDQPFDQIINPYSVLGYAIVLYTIYAIYKFTSKTSRGNRGYMIIAAFLAGTLYGFKSFGGVIIISSMLFLFIWTFIFYKKHVVFNPTILSLVVFIPIFLYTTDLSKAGLKWIPGWILTEMVSSREKIYLPQWVQIENFYRLQNNTLGLMKFKTAELAIYIIGNFGIRLIGLVYLLFLTTGLLFKKAKRQPLDAGVILITLITVLSFSIPLLFNLGQSVHNIVQFTPYSLLMAAIMTGVALELIYRYFQKLDRKPVGIIVILLIIILAIPVNAKNIREKISSKNDLIDQRELTALSYIKSNSQPDDIILIDPRQFDRDQMYVSALSGRRVFLASPDYVRQTADDPSQRLRQIADFFDKGIGDDLFINFGVKYIYYLNLGEGRSRNLHISDRLKTPVKDTGLVLVYKI